MKSFLFCLGSDIEVGTKENIIKHLVTFDTFANGEYNIHFPLCELENNHVFLYKKFCSSRINEELLTLFFATKTISSLRPSKITLLLPYIPYCRKDREDEEKDIIDTVTFKHVTDFLCYAGAHEIITLDLHNPVSKYFSSCAIINIKLSEYFKDMFTPGNIFISPDYGNAKYIAKLAEKYGCSHMVVNKVRTKKNEAIFKGLLGWQEGKDLKEKILYIYDDIVDTGKTLCNLLDYLVQNVRYKEIKVFFPHAILSNNASERLNSYCDKKVTYYTTDSYGEEYKKLKNCTIIPVATLYEKYVCKKNKKV